MSRISKAITSKGGRQGWVYALALVAALGGIIAIVVGVTHQQSAPEPAPSASGHIFTRPSASTAPSPTETPSSSTTPQSPSTGPKPPLSKSRPALLNIPAIGVHTAVIPIGKDPDGTLAVPQPGPNLNKAAWYKYSVTPGQAGPAVIEGHIDSVNGPSVFFRLGALKPGDRITVTRLDHTVTVFTVNGVRSYPTHDAFPTKIVYGGDLSQPTLRLITCSNFDQSIGHYVGNTVVYATLTAVRHAVQ